MLKLMYITNRPEIAQIAEGAGVDWIFVDMEFIGKDARQGGLDTVQNHHTAKDIRKIKNAVSSAKVLVRINPIHEELSYYQSSEVEINEAIDAGADILMLPYFHTVKEVEEFVFLVDGRVKTCLLLETPEAAELLDDILEVPGIDMIHIGLNDMHLALGMNFMFELLANGKVDEWMQKIKAKDIMCGFGGIAGLNTGLLPGAKVLKEHCRLGSEMVIVSRAFCNTDLITDLEEVRQVFDSGLKELRTLEAECEGKDAEFFTNNRKEVIEGVAQIVEIIKSKKNNN